jgi:hypothetical protein
MPDDLGGGRTIADHTRGLAFEENGGLDLARTAGIAIARLLIIAQPV